MRIPSPLVSVQGEDVDLELPGLLSLRAAYLSEGYFDEWAGGDPEEEDLYEVEVTPLRGAMEPIRFPRLSPAAPKSWVDEDGDAADGGRLPMERFVLALAWELASAHPTNWKRVCEAARGWDSWTVEQVLEAAPPDWNAPAPRAAAEEDLW